MIHERKRGDMELYKTIVRAIRDYMKTDDYMALFLTGGCYWFASLVAANVPNSYLMINYRLEHCAVMVEQKLYDITGPISKEGYTYADERQIKYMKKNYRIDIDLTALEQYIRNRVKEYQRKQKIYYKSQLNCDN